MRHALHTCGDTLQQSSLGQLSAAIVISSILCWTVISHERFVDSEPPVLTTAKPTDDPVVRFDAAAFIAPHLHQASERTDQAVASRTAEVQAFFYATEQRTAGFAKAALSWSSKRAMLVDAVPFSGSGSHKRFLQAAFEEQVFAREDLQRVLEQAVAGFMADLASIENQMLVSIRADLESQQIRSNINALDDQQLRAAFRQMIQISADYAALDATGDVATFTASFVIERIISKALFGVARKAGTSAAVLGAGAAGSWASFGTSIVVALIVDQILSKIWDWALDPEGSLKASLDEHLQELGRSACQGNDNTSGLRHQLQQFAVQRDDHRSQALAELITSQLRSP